MIQHPEGQAKQLCVRENKLLRRDDVVLWYTTDTQPGSSGSPVFDNDWYVVALHHSGVPEKKNGIPQTVAGGDFVQGRDSDDNIKWIANEGIRASRITDTLKSILPDHTLLRPLYAATPQSARQVLTDLAGLQHALPPPAPVAPQERKTSPMPETIIVPVELSYSLDAQGRLTILNAQASGSLAARESLSLESAPAAAQPRPASFEVPFNSDYSPTGPRQGYTPDFLGTGDLSVPLPALSPALQAMAVPRLDTGNHELTYINYSLVMHSARRLAIFSAANVRYADRFKNLGRPSDVWRKDPRIPDSAQVTNSYYQRNKFDRGHLTRYEDMEYGAAPVNAAEAAADTCHWTNCTPQHAKFNQNREIWQGIERYILETSIYNGHVNAQIITGPVLDEGDPVYRGLQYPLQYWKVVAALDGEGNLFATAYLASQDAVIAQYGIETTAEPFGAYQNYQVSISEIERLTGLSFTYGTSGNSLSDRDPLARPGRRATTPRVSTNEAMTIAGIPGYHPIFDVEDIIL